MKGKQKGNAKIWVLIAVLAAAAAAVLVLSGNFPPGAEDDVTGTIMPAERYGASQISSEDVVLGTETNAGSGSTQAVDALTSDMAINAGRANDNTAINAGRMLSNDNNAVNAVRANDNNAVNAVRANDNNAVNAVRANDNNAVNAVRANDGRD